MLAALSMAANLVHAKLSTWQDLDAGKAMYLGLWKLFCIKTRDPSQ